MYCVQLRCGRECWQQVWQQCGQQSCQHEWKYELQRSVAPRTNWLNNDTSHGFQRRTQPPAASAQARITPPLRYSSNITPPPSILEMCWFELFPSSCCSIASILSRKSSYFFPRVNVVPGTCSHYVGVSIQGNWPQPPRCTGLRFAAQAVYTGPLLL